MVFLNRFLTTAVCLSSLLLGLLVGFAAAARVPSLAPAAGTGCTLPVTDDRYQGFRIGVPAGWNLFGFAGMTVVSRDVGGTEEAVVEPALLTSGLSPARFFAVAIRALQKEIAAGGNSLSYRITGNKGDLPEASIVGRAGRVGVAGQARVFLLPDRPAHGSQLVVFSAFWAAPARLGADRSALEAVGRCFRPERATLYRVVDDQVFTYPIPLGWRVASEGQDTLTVADGSNASATYLLTLVPASNGVNSANTLLRYVFGKLGIRVTTVLNSIVLPSQRTSSGALAEQEYGEFTGVLNGRRPLHGVVSV